MYEELENQEKDLDEADKEENNFDDEDGEREKPEPEQAAEEMAHAILRESGDSTIVKTSVDADDLLPPNSDPMPPSAFPKPRPRKAPEIAQVERKNWLLHFHFMRKEIPACKSLIEEQLEETSESCEYALYMKGVILRQEGKIQESLDVLQQCAMLDSQNPDYVKQIARSLFLLGRQKNAIDVLNEALKINDQDWAKSVLQQSLKMGKQERTLMLIGKICLEENDLISAIEAYRRALELTPENPDILTKLGLLYLKTSWMLQTESLQQAFEALGRALSFNPSHSGAILAAGSMMQQHGDFDVALTKYRVAAVDMPDNAQLWSNIGMCFFGKKKFVAAISCLKRANYLAPFDWKILYNLGVVHLAMSQYASAFHFVSAAINTQPKVPALFMTLAVALTNLEDFKNARQAYEHALELDKKDPTVCLNFAIFLLKQGEKEKAKEYFSAFESRLRNVRDSKTGQLRIDAEVLEMAEKFRNIMTSGGDLDTSSEKGASSRPSTTSKETPAHLKKDEFDSETISLPPRTPGSASGEERADLGTAASRQTALTLSGDPKLAIEGSTDGLSTSLSFSSRFIKSDPNEESNI